MFDMFDQQPPARLYCILVILSQFSRANITFGGKYPYLYHFISIIRQTRHVWLGPGFIIGLNKNGNKFKETRDNIFRDKDTFSFLNCIHFFSLDTFLRGYKYTLKSSECPESWMIHS